MARGRPAAMSAQRPSEWFHWEGGTLVLSLRVQPRGGRDAFGEVHNGRLKVRIGAAPVDGKANQQLIAFVAASFGVPRGRVRLLAGEAQRDKRVAIEAPGRIPSALAPWIGGQPPGDTQKNQ